MSNGQWFAGVNGQQMGPMSLEQLQSMIGSGQIPASSPVWTEGMANWVPANTLPQFAQGGFAPTPNAPIGYAGPVGYQQPMGPLGGVPDQSGKATGALVCGIISIPGACIWCLGIPLAIVAIALGATVSNPNNKGRAQAGLICGIIGLVLSIGMAVIGFAFRR